MFTEKSEETLKPEEVIDVSDDETLTLHVSDTDEQRQDLVVSETTKEYEFVDASASFDENLNDSG